MNTTKTMPPPVTVRKPSKHEATVKEMIERFRTAPPTSRRHRDQSRHSGTGPKKMWYDSNELQPRYSACQDKEKQKQQDTCDDDVVSVLQLAESMRTKPRSALAGSQNIMSNTSYRFKADATSKNSGGLPSNWGDLEDGNDNNIGSTLPTKTDSTSKTFRDAATTAKSKHFVSNADDRVTHSDDDLSNSDLDLVLPFTIPQVADDLDNGLYSFYETYAKDLNIGP